jgi:hypothetical protein
MRELRPSVRIVSSCVSGDGFVVDVLGVGPEDAVGEPYALVLRRPETLWIADWVDYVLTRWADRCELVDFRVKRGRAGPVAVLEGGDARCSLQMELVAAA